MAPDQLPRTGAQAQQVYRCDIHGNTRCTHTPCPGAQAIDTSPTQGLSRSTGTVRRPPDMQRAIPQRPRAETIRPITGQSPQALAVDRRRMRLSATDKLHCEWLDLRLPSLEAQVAQARADQKGQAELALYQARLQLRDLGC
jgi:hypothetical protein